MGALCCCRVFIGRVFVPVLRMMGGRAFILLARSTFGGLRRGSKWRWEMSSVAFINDWGCCWALTATVRTDKAVNVAIACLVDLFGSAIFLRRALGIIADELLFD